MNSTVARNAVCGIFALVALGSAATAQTASPLPLRTPKPAVTPLAFTARAHADISVVTGDRTISGSAVLGMSQRANLTRVDVISVKTDVLPLPPISASFVIDRNAKTVTAWSTTSKRYFVQRMVPSPSPGPTPTPKPFGIFVGTSPFANLDVLDVSLKMTGHTTTAGIATTGLTIDGHFAKKGSANATHATATVQLADEYGAFPLTIDVLLEPGAPVGLGPPSSPSSVKLSYAVDELTRVAPPIASFRVPAGYTKATSMMAVVFRGTVTNVPASPAP